jgi:peptide deformylase
MAIREILRMGHPILKQKARPVERFGTTELADLVTDLQDTMQARSGAGIAAPQIGVSLRVMLFGIDHNPRYPDAEPVPLTVLVNPEFEIMDSTPQDAWEGCLSVPGMRGRVARPRKIHYSAYDIEGNRFDRVAEDFHARVFLHENDHLDGILYPQRIDDLSQFGFIAELEAAGVLPSIKNIE